MIYERLCDGRSGREPCRNAGSRPQYRGSCRNLAGDYVAFLGGTETFGRFQRRPYPSRFEELTGVGALNLGCVNAGADLFLRDPEVMRACQRARLTVVQVVGAHNMSNRFYTVHPRRNDRFVKASDRLMALYDDVDFTEFNFTRHLLTTLLARSPRRFALVRQELRDAWVARMEDLMRRIGGRPVLLWMADHAPTEVPIGDGLGPDPLFVDHDMLERLRPLAADIVDFTPSATARAKGTEGMLFVGDEQTVAEEQLGNAAHEEVAKMLVARLEPLL